MSTIDTFKANLTGGGARANQFVITFTTASVGLSNAIPSKSQFLCKAAALPGQTVTEIAVPFRGRNLYLAGDREFETWDSTFINDTDFDIRDAIETWMNGMNELRFNTGAADVNEYTADLEINQLGRDGKVLKQYILRNCMPTVMSPIELSMETASAIEEFTVTWRYTHFQSVGVSS
tara:strand:- start:938 stop:1468 length:531 start_codon:yes stop_codon:yes gene_type:complete